MHNIILNNYDDVLIFWPSILQPGSFDSHKTLINFVMDSGSTFTVLKTAPIIIEAWSYLDDRPVSKSMISSEIIPTCTSSLPIIVGVAAAIAVVRSKWE